MYKIIKVLKLRFFAILWLQFASNLKPAHRPCQSERPMAHLAFQHTSLLPPIHQTVRPPPAGIASSLRPRLLPISPPLLAMPLRSPPGARPPATPPTPPLSPARTLASPARPTWRRGQAKPRPIPRAATPPQCPTRLADWSSLLQLRAEVIRNQIPPFVILQVKDHNIIGCYQAMRDQRVKI